MSDLDFLLSHAPTILTKEEESAAIQAAMEGSTVARDKLITSNLKLVVKIAKRHWRSNSRIDLLDLVQEGNEGLIESLSTYDPDKGTRFTSHAGWRIRARVLRFIVANVRLIRVKRGESERLLFQLVEARKQLEGEGIEPTSARLAEVLNADVGKVEEMQGRLHHNEGSLNEPRSDDSAAGEMIDSVPDNSVDTFASVASKECCKQVGDRLRVFLDRWNLSDRDRAILRFRILTDNPVALVKIGEDFGLSKQRIQQIEVKLRDRVQFYLRDIKADLT